MWYDWVEFNSHPANSRWEESSMQISCQFRPGLWQTTGYIKESLALLISADTGEAGSNHWLLLPLRNTNQCRLTKICKHTSNAQKLNMERKEREHIPVRSQSQRVCMLTHTHAHTHTHTQTHVHTRIVGLAPCGADRYLAAVSKAVLGWFKAADQIY